MVGGRFIIQVRKDAEPKAKLLDRRFDLGHALSLLNFIADPGALLRKVIQIGHVIHRHTLGPH